MRDKNKQKTRWRKNAISDWQSKVSNLTSINERELTSAIAILKYKVTKRIISRREYTKRLQIARSKIS